MSTQKVPAYYPDVEEHRRLLANSLNNVIEGKINSTGSITLENSVTTTDLEDDRIGIDSVILLMPTTSDAAAENIYFSAQDKGVVTLNHTSNTTSRIFKYVVIG
jgi:hypothetical protein